MQGNINMALMYRDVLKVWSKSLDWNDNERIKTVPVNLKYFWKKLKPGWTGLSSEKHVPPPQMLSFDLFHSAVTLKIKVRSTKT